MNLGAFALTLILASSLRWLLAALNWRAFVALRTLTEGRSRSGRQ